MKGECAKCGIKESYAWKNVVSEHQKFELCADCAHISAKHIPLHIKKQQTDHEKDIIQPYKYSKQEKANIPNPDFAKVYGKKKAKAFSYTFHLDQESKNNNYAKDRELDQKNKNVGLCQAAKPATVG